jgi:hypothetical protein
MTWPKHARSVAFNPGRDLKPEPCALGYGNRPVRPLLGRNAAEEHEVAAVGLRSWFSAADFIISSTIDGVVCQFWSEAHESQLSAGLPRLHAELPSHQR